jgi:hypothetical protein
MPPCAIVATTTANRSHRGGVIGIRSEQQQATAHPRTTHRRSALASLAPNIPPTTQTAATAYHSDRPVAGRPTRALPPAGRMARPGLISLRHAEIIDRHERRRSSTAPPRDRKPSDGGEQVGQRHYHQHRHNGAAARRVSEPRRSRTWRPPLPGRCRHRAPAGDVSTSRRQPHDVGLRRARRRLFTPGRIDHVGSAPPRRRNPEPDGRLRLCANSRSAAATHHRFGADTGWRSASANEYRASSPST